MLKNKYQIVLSSTCLKTLTLYVNFLTKKSKEIGITFSILYLPKKEKYFTILKSPHVFKKAKEQFKLSKYKCLLTTTAKENNGLLKSSFLFINRPKSIHFLFKV